MAEVSMVEAVRLALEAAMADDERVVLLGEDIGALGGVFRATDGLVGEFGEARVIDTPMAELSIVGIAVGLALRGLRPVAEIQFGDFIYAAADQILSEAAKYRFRTAGEWSVPLVVRATWGAGIHGALYHSQSIEAVFCHFPGLKVVAPSTPADAAGLLRSAIDDPDPVIFLEHKGAYRRVRGELADPRARVPIGPARIVRPGADASVVAYGWMVHEALAAAERLALEDGLDVEVLDLRTLLPMDTETIVASARRTGRVCVVHEDTRTMGLGAEIAAGIHEACFHDLVAPVVRVTMPDVAGIPYAEPLEQALIPDAEAIAQAVRELAASARPLLEAPRLAGAAVRDGRYDLGTPQASLVTAVDIANLDSSIDLSAHLVHAAAQALVAVPDANSAWAEGELRRNPAAHIALVEADGKDGMRRIVIPNAEELTPLGVDRLLARSRAGDAPTPDVAPTFTLIVPAGSPLFGVPRVPEGQVAAVQVGAATDAVVAVGGALAVRRQVYLALSAADRILDGAAAARFLAAIKERLEGLA